MAVQEITRLSHGHCLPCVLCKLALTQKSLKI